MSPTSAVPELSTAGPRKFPKNTRGEFRIDGETFHLIQPKQTLMAQVMTALESGVPLDETGNMKIMLQFVWQLVAYVDDETVMVKDPNNPGKMKRDDQPHGRALLERRLNDPRDSLDLDQVMRLLLQILGVWTARPTKSPAGSTPSRRRAAPRARASRARTR